ncbi:hypothetical protein [Asticcacaulis machinosus]|uniref:Uncharacterized protein n=1 Tax=Asticcacaulis machinosus TaxID=2984211 RepID=A0ABT5HK72_9CAUL|nr:hypothetical protein [Asticcacaulis machinosus]MDC7676650.1 hypothetical protein [Asticcacaulis machinosus]
MNMTAIIQSARKLTATRKILRELMRETGPHEGVRLTPAKRRLQDMFRKKTSPFALKAGQVEVWLEDIHQHHPSFFDEVEAAKTDTDKKSALKQRSVSA